jgi:2-dehydro-3-deoxyphosphooctonate aldolase (KDO 8-P synthase)
MGELIMQHKFIIGEGLANSVDLNADKLTVIAGPCAIESREHTFFMASKLLELSKKIGFQLIFKSSYDKDCRSSNESYLGCGLDDGLRILHEVRNNLQVPVTTDISRVDFVRETAEVVDLLQIPAYLCRQTHLLVACGETGKPINIKKGQFMSPWNMKNSVRKIIKRTNNDKIILTERGTFFGYNMLVNDFRSFKIMKEINQYVCYDATHSVQLPTGNGDISAGQREFIPSLTRAAVATGLKILFMEVHDKPDTAKSDPATQIDLITAEYVLNHSVKLYEFVKSLRIYDEEYNK